MRNACELSDLRRCALVSVARIRRGVQHVSVHCAVCTVHCILQEQIGKM